MPTSTEPISTDRGVADWVAALPLIDHHVHGVVPGDVDRSSFEELITESDRGPAQGTTVFDSQLGFAVRRWCAPILDLEPFADPDDYLRRRGQLGAAEVNRRLLRAAGFEALLLDTGHLPELILAPDQMADAAGARALEVVRLEAVVEDLARTDVAPGSLRAAMAAELRRRMVGAVGVKTIAAYRIQLDFDPGRPTPEQVDEAAADWLAAVRPGGRVRLDHPVLIREMIWNAVDLGTAIQFHIGFGDPDVDLHRVNPLCLTGFLRLTRDSGARVMLLHCYPFHREAGYLAHVFEHVYCDVGLAINYVGSQSEQVIAESLELTPFTKALFSSDAFGAAELHYLGAHLFRRGLTRCLHRWAGQDGWPAAEQRRVAELIGRRNAIRGYRLSGL